MPRQEIWKCMLKSTDEVDGAVDYGCFQQL